MLRFSYLFIACVLCASGASDLKQVLEEPNLEKRSELALDHSEQAVDRARTAYVDGNLTAFKSALQDVREGAELSYKSLQDTGKPARKRPKFYKRAEKDLVLIMRKLENLEQEVSVDERALVSDYRRGISELHDRILTDIMTKKK